MNAYQLYLAVFDSARSEFLPSDTCARIDDVISYADGAFDLFISRSVAEKIVECHAEFEEATTGQNGNGEITNNLFHYVEKPLSVILL